MVEIAKHGGTSQQRESASIHYSAAMSVVQLSRYWAPQNIAPICIASQTAEEVFSVMGVLGISSNPLYLDSSDSEGAINGLMPALFSKWKHAERVGVAPYMGINPDILQFRSFSLFLVGVFVHNATKMHIKGSFKCVFNLFKDAREQ
jgi:hypothetical protein